MKSHALVYLSAILSLTAASATAGEVNRASKILTEDVAQKILKAPVLPGTRNNDPDTEMGKIWVSKVSYTTKDDSPDAVQISLLIRHAASREEAQSIFESSKSTFHGEGVAGLGDAAYRVKVLAQLNVLKGTEWLIISAGTPRAADAALQERAAREVLARMPN